MKSLFMLVMLATAPVMAQSSESAAAKAPAPVPIPQSPQVINLNLLDALIAIQAQDMAGVFSFIPEPNAPPAMADYLLHNKTFLKRFLKKGEKNLKEVGGISEWDQQVYRYMMAIYSSGTMKEGSLSKDLIERISKLSLATAFPLADIKLRQK